MNRFLPTTSTRHIRRAAAGVARVVVWACLSAGKQRFAGMARGNRQFVGPVEEGSSLP